MTDTAWLTTAEAAAFTRFSAYHLRRLARYGVFKRGIHYTRPTGHLRWRRDALAQWLETCREGTWPGFRASRPRRRGRSRANPLLLEQMQASARKRSDEENG